MSKPQTIIGKAKRLQELHGKEYAIEFFKKRLEESTNIFDVSGNETAIEWLEIGQAGMEEKARDILKDL
jgi:hypothetical protein